MEKKTQLSHLQWGLMRECTQDKNMCVCFRNLRGVGKDKNKRRYKKQETQWGG